MASFQNHVWDDAFNFPFLTKSIPKKKYNLILKDKFNGESEISTSIHSFIFLRNYISCKIIDKIIIYRLYTHIHSLNLEMVPYFSNWLH